MNCRAPRLAVALAPLALAACALPQRAPADRDADRALSARVEAALTNDPRIFARHVDVDAAGSTVYLSGYVWSTAELFEARQVAASVPGVRRVDSELELFVGGRNGH